QYYEPLRHPSRPGLSLASCQLIQTATTAGTSRVAYGPLCLHAVANIPAGLMETCSLIRFHQLRPSPKPGRVGSCVSRFEACLAFTHVMACKRCLRCCSDCYRVERPVPGRVTPAVDHRLSRRTRFPPLIGRWPSVR